MKASSMQRMCIRSSACHYAMNTVRKIRFLLLALLLHWAALWVILSNTTAKEGKAYETSGLQRNSQVLQLSILPEKNDRPAVLPASSSADDSSTSIQTAIQALSEPLTSIAPVDKRAVAEAFTQQTVDSAMEAGSRAAALQEYVLAGQLTRLPVPATEIDLNVPEIQERLINGSVNLTILIDATGIVSDVFPAVENDDLRYFAQQVANIFKLARFRPGEIDGRPVRSQLQITVVSEESPAL